MKDNIKKAIASRWTNVVRKPRTNWWESSMCIRYINKIICGRDILGWNSGAIDIIRDRFKTPFTNGISIGAGMAIKELGFVKNNIVSQFDIFELSQQRIDSAKNIVKKSRL